jgi:hypothetical protein
VQSSQALVEKIVNAELLEKFKQMIATCGPQLRLVELFSAVCFVAGEAQVANQEMVLRMLWAKRKDRYSALLTFHEVSFSPPSPLLLLFSNASFSLHCRMLLLV